MPAIRRGGRRGHDRALACLDGGAAAGRRRPADQPDRRHHQLRASSSSASRCTPSICARLAGAEIRVRRAKPGETITTLDGVERTLEPDMLVIADRDRAQAVAGVMGGAASEVSAATTTRRVRERVLQAGVGPAHEQAARPEDRGLVALRARRRHRRPGRGAAARVALMEQIGAGRAGRRRSSTAIRAPRGPAALHLRRERLALAARRDGARTPTSCGSCAASASTSRLPPTAGTSSRRPSASTCCARSISSRKSAATTASTSSSRRSPPMTRPAPPPDPRVARDQLVRRVLTAAGFSEAVTFGFIEAKAAELVLRRRETAEPDPAAARLIAVDRQPAVGEVRHAAAVAAARPGRRRRAQPPARPARRAAVRDRHALRARRRDARRWRSRGPAAAAASTGRAARARSTSSTSRASSSSCATRSACRCGSNRAAKPFLVGRPDGRDPRRRRRRSRSGDRPRRAGGAGGRRRARRCRGRIASSSPS